jgi:hypothetical protein
VPFIVEPAAVRSVLLIVVNSQELSREWITLLVVPVVYPAGFLDKIDFVHHDKWHSRSNLIAQGRQVWFRADWPVI